MLFSSTQESQQPKQHQPKPAMALEALTPQPGPSRGSERTPLIPDYQLLRKIGGGGYGDVWLGRSATGTMRAVKVVWRANFENERPFCREFEGIQNFERLSREHPSQLALFHVGRNEEAGYFYYVMELADDLAPVGGPGERAQHLHYEPHTLRAELQKGRLPAEKVLKLGLALTEALAHLHANGLVHRDVKPSNIIFVDGRPKLADIGLVTDASDARSVVGTEGYLAPEGPGTPQADLFALGKVLYEATTGMNRRDFPQLPPELRSWPDAALVFELNEIFLKAGAENAKERYRTAEEVRADLLLLQSGKSPKRYHAIERRLAVVTRAGVILGIVALLAAAVLYESNRQRKRVTATLVRLQVSNGTRLMNEGDYFGSLLAFTEALRLDAGNAKREEPHRIRIASLLQQCPKLVGVFPHDHLINGVAFSPDGLSVLTSADDQRAKVWDVHSGTLRFELRHHDPVYSASYSPDGRIIMTASSRLHFWNGATGQELPINTIKNFGQWTPPQPCFSPDGKLVATVVGSTNAQLWSFETGGPVGPPLNHRAGLSKIVFSSDSTLVATLGDDRVAQVWNTKTGERRWEFTHRNQINDAVFSPDNRQLVTASDNFVRFWDLATGKLEKPSLQHVDWVGGISFSPEGDRLVTMCYDKTAQVWDLGSRAPLAHPLRQEIGLQSARFTPDGRRIVTTGGTRVRIWDADTMELIPPVLSDSQWRDPAFISPDGHLFATFSGNEARLWNFATVEPAPIPVRAIPSFKPTATSSNHRFIARIGGDNIVRLMEAESSKPWTQPITEAASIRQAYFLTNNEVLVTERDDTRSRLWHVGSGQPLTPLLKSRYVWQQSADFNPELPRDQRPTLELTRLAQLLSRMRVDQIGGFQPLDPRESVGLWNEFKRKYEGQFTISQKEALAWEDQQAAAAAQAWDWWAASFHLRALLAAGPKNESTQKRLAYAADALEHAGKSGKSRYTKLHATPPRDPSSRPEHIDLSRFFTKSIKDSDPSIPTGVQNLGGVSFDVRGIVQLAGMGSKNAGDNYPEQANGIPVARKCQHLYFLQASGWETFVGVRIGSYIVHYANHRPKEVPIVFGKDVLSSWTSANEGLRTSRSQLVWVGSGPAVQNDGKSLRMFKTIWENPYPDDVIEQIDFASKMSEAAPFVVAITAD
jgi:WD40 repeat protein/serine/threonine protein kinase